QLLADCCPMQLKCSPKTLCLGPRTERGRAGEARSTFEVPIPGLRSCITQQPRRRSSGGATSTKLTPVHHHCNCRSANPGALAACTEQGRCRLLETPTGGTAR